MRSRKKSKHAQSVAAARGFSFTFLESLSPPLPRGARDGGVVLLSVIRTPPILRHDFCTRAEEDAAAAGSAAERAQPNRAAPVRAGLRGPGGPGLGLEPGSGSGKGFADDPRACWSSGS